MAEKNSLALQTIVDKYARLDGVAYTFVDDGNGKIIPDSLEAFAPELQTTWSFNNDPGVPWKELIFQGRAVYETRAPIVDRPTGTAHVGLWAHVIEADIQQTLF